MASSSLVFEVYAPQRPAGGVRWRNLLRAWLPVLACAIAVAVESTTYFGANRTSAPLRHVAEAFFGNGVDAQWRVIHLAIRKTGHFVGYGIFSLICFRGFWIALHGAASRMSRQLRAHGLAILSTLLAAGADEFHQSFLPNRMGRFSDVLLDTCGGVALCFVLFLLMQARARVVCRREAACVSATA